VVVAVRLQGITQEVVALEAELDIPTALAQVIHHQQAHHKVATVIIAHHNLLPLAVVVVQAQLVVRELRLLLAQVVLALHRLLPALQ
jgi:hypothetical protein